MDKQTVQTPREELVRLLAEMTDEELTCFVALLTVSKQL